METIREQTIGNMRQEFFSSGLQYYIAARYCCFAQLSPTGANQAHHAIEMLLKGFLFHKLAGQSDQEPEQISKQLKKEFLCNRRGDHEIIDTPFFGSKRRE